MMHRVHSRAFRFLAVTLLLLSFFAGRMQAQAPPSQNPVKEADARKAEEDPREPEPPTSLPAGTGSNANDPRAKLSPGWYDAGEASKGIKHLLLLKKPDQFQQDTIDASNPMAQLAFGNSDIAFQGNHLFMGNFHGINIYDISDPEKARLVTSMVCPGGQGDVSVYKNLLFMSVEEPNGRIDCGVQGFPPVPPLPAGRPVAGRARRRHVSTPQIERFRGVRIFDISDIKSPKQIAAVQTCRGSHTHTLVLDPKDKKDVYIYVSGISFVRPKEELAGCSGEAPDKNPNTSLFRIEVIKVPLAAPQNARVVSTPRVFVDPRTGALNSLRSGATHGIERPTPSTHCHDITVYSQIGLAAGACSGNGIVLDIKDPVHPRRLDAVNDPNYAYWHSASFSNDGTKVVFTDEWGGGLGARCRPNDPNKWGADSVFNLQDNKLKFASYYKMPAAQGDTENCVAHNGSLVPVPGRDIEVQAWYQGGISVMDFTDAKHPFEIAYFDRGPIDPKTLVIGGHWSAYWYNGHIYASEIARGLDILELTPNEFLTQNEIDAAKTVQVAELNVQNQQRIEWPPRLVVARAYLDQLERSQALTADQIKPLRDAIQSAESSDLKDLAKFNSFAQWLKERSEMTGSAVDTKRLQALAEILQHLAK
ncbi:MAG: hypothetical protein J2P41_07670 [Blastocatellia bacterium]|nr:hypothetical protein [Blastocatellia bacterium]